MKSSSIYIIAAIAIILISLNVITNPFNCGGATSVEGVKVDTTQTTTIDTTEFRSRIEAELKTKFEAEMRRDTEYVEIQVPAAPVDVDSIFNQAKEYWKNKLKDSVLGKYTYTASGDTLIIIKDDQNRVRDSLHIQAKYESDIPLSLNGKLKLLADLHSYSYDKTTETQIKKTVTVKDWLDNFYTGAGVTAIVMLIIFFLAK